MYYSREEHFRFLEEDLAAETKDFEQKLATSASFLLIEREELFVAKFIKFNKGELILKFNNERGIPRRGEYLYCFTTPKELHNFKEWGQLTYGDLIKRKGFATQLVSVWQQSLKDDPGFCLVGFRGVDMDFAEHINGHEGAFLILGPNVPPYEYVHNLQNIVQWHYNDNNIKLLLEGSTSLKPFEAMSINGNNIPNFILSQLSISNSVVLQGPPGTGKTHQIACICKTLCEQGKSILVTALTNRALVEVAGKDALADLLQKGSIYKTKVSVDEAEELPQLQNSKDVMAQPGQIMLSTFYIASGEAAKTHTIPPFDVVIMDEASQALYGMFIAVSLLGKQLLFVGDPRQLSAVTKVNEDRVTRRNYSFYIDGLSSYSIVSSVPCYRLNETWRLPPRAAEYTGIFYDNTLHSCANAINMTYPNMPSHIGHLFHPKGGPTLIKTDLPLGDKRPNAAAFMATALTAALLSSDNKLNIAVLSFYVDTTKMLQKFIVQSVGKHSNILIDTVSRIQGLTTDVVLYVIPNTSYAHAIDARLFNVATSRARRQTLIICDKDILSNVVLDQSVRDYIQRLDSEYSFYFPINKDGNILLK